MKWGDFRYFPVGGGWVATGTAAALLRVKGTRCYCSFELLLLCAVWLWFPSLPFIIWANNLASDMGDWLHTVGMLLPSGVAAPLGFFFVKRKLNFPPFAR